jgi:cyclophilin family peptidyl-prolyl cis-trans isomerase
MSARVWPICCCFLLAGSLIVRAGTLAQFRTSVGNFDLELYDNDKPITVQNFLRYVTNGLYTNMIMHRVITNFIVQGGWWAVTNRGTTNWDFYQIPTFPPITNEFKKGQFYSNVYGTIVMAKSADPNSADSQFFFNLANNSAQLDDTNNSGGFTVFGHLVAGTNSLNAFLVGPTNMIVKEVNAGYPFSELPVLVSATNGVYDSDLIYVDISLLKVQVTLRTNRVRDISWNSVSNHLNYVEFTTNFPPSWQVLVTTNGSGSRLTVSDSSLSAPSRFYRVRVGY